MLSDASFFPTFDRSIYPYWIPMLEQVESEDRYERIGGTATGGGTFWGMGSLLTKAKVRQSLSSFRCPILQF